MPKPILVISYAFPPLAAPEAFLAAKTLASLHPLEVDVVYASPDSSVLPIDSSLEPYVRKNIRGLYPVSSPILQNSWLRKGLFAVSHFPDRARLLNRAAFKKVLELDPSKYRGLITWSQFHSAHLVGLRLKRAYPQLPWMAHFSDPWADNPFLSLGTPNRWLQRRLESPVIRSCDALVVTSERTVDLMCAHYPPEIREITHVIPHPFDASLYPSRAISRAGILFRYLGRFYGPRNPVVLLDAIDHLLSASPDILNGVRFEFYGCGSGFEGEGRLQNRKYSAWVGVFPSCTYLKSLELMSEADVNLIIDAPFQNTVFLPSKLVDALGSGSQLFGITPEGTSSDVIRQMGGCVANPSNISDVAGALVNAISRCRSKSSPPSCGEAMNQYSMMSVGEKMRMVLKKIGVYEGA